jgi:hypothetical protein
MLFVSLIAALSATPHVLASEAANQIVDAVLKECSAISKGEFYAS